MKIDFDLLQKIKKMRAEYIQGIFDAIEKGIHEGNQIREKSSLTF